jgi:hypothetical protein
MRAVRAVDIGVKKDLYIALLVAWTALCLASGPARAQLPSVTGSAGLTQATNQPAGQRLIDPRAMRMQRAVLKDQDIHEVEALLKQGVDINAPIGCGTYAPLDGAVGTQNLKLLKFRCWFPPARCGRLTTLCSRSQRINLFPRMA